ncbi:MAG: CDP-glycerol glycerophosphotransferase family protein [Kofleriaceae bacterium]
MFRSLLDQLLRHPLVSHPAIQRRVRRVQREINTRRFFREGPRRRGSPRAPVFVIVNHCYDLDLDALCAAPGDYTLWVFDPFTMFPDIHYFFPPGQRDLDCVYGEGPMRASIERYKEQLVRPLVRHLIRETELDALIASSDVFYYLRPIIEELRTNGIPTIVQDKEGTIAPGPIMDKHARLLAERYPPIADQYYVWNETHRDFWHRAGMAIERMHILGQPRSDFFFHRERWPSKASMGLSSNKKLVVVFTFDTDAYLRATGPMESRPWQDLRDATHDVVRELARERDDVEVVIKAHPQQEQLAEIQTEFAHPPPNVKVITGAASASHLMVHADVIVGFQSTAMIEAMLTPAPVFYVGWGPRHAELADALIPIHTSGGCIVPAGRDDFAQQLRRGLAGELAPSTNVKRARKAFTDRYFFEADGHCAERVLQAAARYARHS